MEDGSFSLHTASGTGRQRAADKKLYEFIHNETAVATSQAV
jgi:hypothetical protein